MSLVQETSLAPTLKTAKRLVIKVGSALLVDQETGRVNKEWLASLCADIAAFRARGQEVLVVSSGSIATGRRYLGFKHGPLKLEESQAAAAAGMMRLAHAYQDALDAHDLIVGQVLLTLDDTENRRRYLNARSTLDQLLKLGALPLINENDTVATDKIRFGDNDRLAARVAAMVTADALVLLSSIDGLYDRAPTDPTATHIPVVEGVITPEIEAMAGDEMTLEGSGGMTTKLMAAKLAMGAGAHMVIADGRDLAPLSRIEAGARATWFVPTKTPRAARKQWISGGLKPLGTLVVDEGAARALGQGKSLLPAGVTEVQGTFERGDPVVIETQAGQALGRGLSAYGSDDAVRIKGVKSAEIERLLGFRGRDEIIHRDDLVLD